MRRLGLGRLVDAVGVRVAPAVGTFTLEVDGLRLHGNHIGQLYYVRELLESSRESFFVDVLRAAARPGATVVDAGSHLGYVTLQAARAVGPTGRVVAFEPNPRSVDLVRRNAAENGLADRVTVMPLALGAEAGRYAFYLSGGGDTSSLHDPGPSAEMIEVDVVRGDDRLGEGAVDVLKLDVEGAEVDALRGLERTISRSLPGLVVLAECNPEALGRAGTTPEALAQVLRDHGLEVAWIDENARRLEPFDGVPAGEGYVNLVAAVPEAGIWRRYRGGEPLPSS